MTSLAASPTESHWASRRSLALAAAVLAAVVVPAVLVYLVLASQLTSTTSSLHAAQRQIETMQTDLAKNRKELAGIKAESDLTLVNKKLTKQGAQLALYNECLPELQSELSGLSLSTEWQTIYGTPFLTSAYVQNNTTVSRHCQGLIYGNTSNGD